MRTSLLVLVTVLVSSCASRQERATRATGLCAGAKLRIWDREKRSGVEAWSASCNQGVYRCRWGDVDVQCQYLPICGNDRHYDMKLGRYRR
jgi:hypothetical protein